MRLRFASKTKNTTMNQNPDAQPIMSGEPVQLILYVCDKRQTIDPSLDLSYTNVPSHHYLSY